MESKFAASQSYGLDKSRFHFIVSAFDLVEGLASILLGWMPWLWDVSEGLVTKWGYGEWEGDIPTSLVFLGLGLIIQVKFAECESDSCLSRTRVHQLHQPGVVSTE